MGQIVTFVFLGVLKVEAKNKKQKTKTKKKQNRKQQNKMKQKEKNTKARDYRHNRDNLVSMFIFFLLRFFGISILQFEWLISFRMFL